MSGIIRKLLLAGVSLLALCAPASADPIFTPIALALWSGPLGAVFSVNAIYTGLQIATAAALSVGSALVGRQQQRIDPGKYKNTFEESDGSEINAIGRVRLGGLKAFGNTKEFDRYRLVWHCKGLLVAIEKYILGGREVTVEVDGTVSSPPYAKPDGSYVNVQTKVGDGSEAAWPDLITAFPSLWTADHRCRGIAQSLVRYTSPGIYNKKFGKMYQGGEPALEIEGRVQTVFDPRDAAQDKDETGTWTWTDNGPLCAARVMLAYPDITVDDFDWTFIAGEADRADALVATKTGTEKRSRCSGIWLSEAKRGDTMRQVLDSIGAEIVLSDEGLIRIRLIDDVPEAEIQFLDGPHITDFSWKSGPEAVERPNVCQVKYYSPELNYEMGEIDMTGIGWARIDNEVTRYGEKPFVAEYPFCASSAQAQRNARRDFALARGDTGVIRTNMAGQAAWGLTYADIEDEDAEEMMRCKISPPRIDDQAGEVEIPFVVWPSLPAWNPASDEAAAPEQVPAVEYVSDIATPAAPVAASVVQYPDLSYETRVKFAAVSGGEIAEAVYRTYTNGEPNAFTSMTEYSGAGTARYAWAAADTDGERVDFKVRFFDEDEEGSYFSDLLTVNPMAIVNTKPDAPTITVEPTAGGSQDKVTVKTSQMHVAKLLLQEWIGPSESGHWETRATGEGRPEEALVYTGSTSISGLYQAFAYSSDGTVSDVATP